MTFSMQLRHLAVIISRAMCFYTALFELDSLARGLFGDLVGKVFRYDNEYKGIIEVLYEDGLVCGFAVHWPNGTTSRYRRGRAGCQAINLRFRDEGFVPVVGLYASRRGAFSPLVEEGSKPTYQSMESGRAVSWEDAIEPDSVDDPGVASR
jgi:hypothetical protein